MIVPLPTPRYHEAIRRGCSLRLYQAPVINIKQGVTAASKTPSRTRRVTMPRKFLAMQCTGKRSGRHVEELEGQTAQATMMPQIITLTPRYFDVENFCIRYPCSGWEAKKVTKKKVARYEN